MGRCAEETHSQHDPWDSDTASHLAEEFIRPTPIFVTQYFQSSLSNQGRKSDLGE